MPGELLPLWLRHPADKRAIETTLKSSHRLFAVVRRPQFSQCSLVVYCMHALCMLMTLCILHGYEQSRSSPAQEYFGVHVSSSGALVRTETETDTIRPQHLRARYALKFH